MNWAVVMAGGPGTRFWPESRRERPKPFLKLAGPKTLLEAAVNRLSPLFPPERILVVLQKRWVRKAQKLLPRIPKKNFLGEPVGRNTGPCAVWAALEIERRDPRARFVLLPADQAISPEALFRAVLKKALAMADEDPVLIGFKPTWPSPAYGYLEVSKPRPLGNRIKALSIRRFCEKPSPERAKQFLRQGNYLWNGGIFAWRLDAFKRAAQTHLPQMDRALDRFIRWGRGLERIYRQFPSVSIDYGILEKLKHAHCLTAPIQWNDLGSWEGIAGFWRRDSLGNRVQGNALLIDSEANIVKAGKRMTALVGMKGFLVVDSGDALLVCPRAKAEEVRKIVQELERQKAYQYL